MIGKLKGRRRRVIKTEGKPDRFNITLVVVHQQGENRIDLFSDDAVPQGLPVVGDAVCIPVGVRVFSTKAGPKYALSVAGTDAGEEF